MGDFELRKMFKKAFGYDVPSKSFSIQQASERVEYSTLGSPYYGKDLWKREHFLPVYLNGYLLPFAVIGMIWSKKYVDTPMPKRNGTVHELIAIDSYRFNIKGIAITEDNSFPEREMIALRNLFENNNSVEIRSVLSDIVLGDGNHSVVITDMKFPAQTGIEHAKPFEIEVQSDALFYIFKNSK